MLDQVSGFGGLSEMAAPIPRVPPAFSVEERSSSPEARLICDHGCPPVEREPLYQRLHFRSVGF